MGKNLRVTIELTDAQRVALLTLLATTPYGRGLTHGPDRRPDKVNLQLLIEHLVRDAARGAVAAETWQRAWLSECFGTLEDPPPATTEAATRPEVQGYVDGKERG